MIKNIWSKDSGSVDKWLGKCGLMIKNMWSKDLGGVD